MLRDDVLEFIRSLIKTVWSLELLLLMRRTAQCTWTSDELIKELRSSRNIVSDTVTVFVQAGILREEEAGFRYAPAAPELDQLIEELAREYAERPTSVINTIVDAQSGKLQAFANAFRLKRD